MTTETSNCLNLSLFFFQHRIKIWKFCWRNNHQVLVFPADSDETCFSLKSGTLVSCYFEICSSILLIDFSFEALIAMEASWQWHSNFQRFLPLAGSELWITGRASTTRLDTDYRAFETVKYVGKYISKSSKMVPWSNAENSFCLSKSSRFIFKKHFWA